MEKCEICKKECEAGELFCNVDFDGVAWNICEDCEVDHYDLERCDPTQR